MTAGQNENSQDSWYLGPDFNLRPPEHEAGLLTFVPQCLFCSYVNIVEEWSNNEEPVQH
jgi:hypothetical protein